VFQRGHLEWNGNLDIGSVIRSVQKYSHTSFTRTGQRHPKFIPRRSHP